MSIEAPETLKQKAIAQAAFLTFAEHGYRSTSMQMIAERAGMSRPALYLHFQNKEDVFRFLTQDFFQNATQEAERIFKRDLPAAVALSQMFDAFNPGGVMEILLSATHGHELLDAKASIAQDIVLTSMGQMQKALETWIAEQTRRGKFTCPDPALSAQTILSAYEGIKLPRPDYQTYVARVSHLADILGKGLEH